MAKKERPQTQETLQEPVSKTAAAGNAQKYRYIYTRKSVERRIRRRRVAIVLLVFVLVASLIAAATYAVLSFVDYNSFRVSITQGKAHLTLSNDEAFTNPTTQLSTGAAKNMLDTTYNALPGLKLSNLDGSYEGENNFFGSSFYLRSTTDDVVYYEMQILITNVYNRLDSCVRVLVIREPLQLNEDGEWELVSRTYKYVEGMTAEQALQAEKEASRYKHYVCYAKERTEVGEDGETREQVAYNVGRDGEEMNSVYNPNYSAPANSIWYCTNFVDPDLGTVTEGAVEKLEPWQKVRYTFVIWLEGSDPDTTDDKLGGSLTMNISFATVDAADYHNVEVEEEEELTPSDTLPSETPKQEDND